MANIFSGGGRELDLSNGGTEAFIEVLILAVSDLASEAWDLRFAALLILQDQNVMGRGAVGFHLEEIDWGVGESERARSKDFVLSATALAASGHRWSDLGYHPPRVHDYLDQFRIMVAHFTPPSPKEDGPHHHFPGPDEAVMASCTRHRVLSALPYWEGCFLCNQTR
ncbi:hypothetical protein GCM10010234_17880 [Streptomyces hawaiiensis]|uniref:hypothetical protein n=1 Tax=Streptomyces hawaiiensis TaxID=67305 RepID=UPI0031DB433B